MFGFLFTLSRFHELVLFKSRLQHEMFTTVTWATRFLTSRHQTVHVYKLYQYLLTHFDTVRWVGDGKESARKKCANYPQWLSYRKGREEKPSYT